MRRRAQLHEGYAGLLLLGIAVLAAALVVGWLLVRGDDGGRTPGSSGSPRRAAALSTGRGRGAATRTS
jgi:hypothetical protein